MFQFGGFMMFPDHVRPFNNTYKCYSVSMCPGNDRQDVEKGGKIIMPPSALDQLTRLNVEYPMLFKLTNVKKNRMTHAGVLEFVADEGKIYIPYWMMRNLLMEEGDHIQLESLSLPVATFSKFQPQSPDFLDITNPKAVLENALRNFACLTTGDSIAIKYNSKIYELCVLETKPGPAVTIIECDMNVEFAPPIGYKEPQNNRNKDESEMEELKNGIGNNVGGAGISSGNGDLLHNDIHNQNFLPFSGSGMRLDGKKKKIDRYDAPIIQKNLIRGVPDYTHTYGVIRFDRSIKPISDRIADDNNIDPDLSSKDDFKTFQGQGFSLRRAKK